MAELAMVTGASSGIGRAYAERLARDGWDLVVVARRRDRLEELADQQTNEHGVAVRVVEADLSQHDQLESLCGELADLRVDMLVNNAGLAHYMDFGVLPPEQADELVHLNVRAPVLLARAVLSGMQARSRGAIINIASLLAFSGGAEAPYLPKRAVYAASKAFLVSFTQLLATEVKADGIRAQVVCPGVVRSEFHTRQGMDMSGVERMEPEAVVKASLFDLERGEVICIPGLADPSSLERFETASLEFLSSTRTTELPARYRQPGG